jgi:hypothetical protein
MTGDSWNTYTSFFTHVQQTCFFFKQELWQESTSKLIIGLENSSTQVLEGLDVNI